MMTADAQIAVALGTGPGLRVEEMVVTEDDARCDREWFANHPQRCFRARAGDGGIWLIRRVPQGADPAVLLRALSRSHRHLDETDGDLAPTWFAAAYPDWPVERVLRRARKLLKKRPA